MDVSADAMKMTMLDGILLGCGILLVGYCIIATIWMGTVSFNWVLLGIAAVLLLLFGLDRHFGALAGVVRFKKIALPIVLCGLVIFGVLEAIVISGAARKDTARADYIIVLGAGLRGEKMSLTQLRRVETALACEQGEKLVVTGGQGWDEDIAEGEAMRRWLVEQNFPMERIIVEDKSTNTQENLAFSKKLIEADAGKSIAELHVKIVTSDFHSYRAQMLARRQGYAQVSAYGSPTPSILVPSFYIREGLALAKSFLLDR